MNTGHFKDGTLVYVCDGILGPTFASELEQQGCLFGQHFSWYRPYIPSSEDPYYIEFFEDTPQHVVDGVLEVYEAHDPTKTPPAEQP